MIVFPSSSYISSSGSATNNQLLLRYNPFPAAPMAIEKTNDGVEELLKDI